MPTIFAKNHQEVIFEKWEIYVSMMTVVTAKYFWFE